MTHSVLLLILNALAVFRITRLVTADTILEGVRDLLTGPRYAGGRDRSGFRQIVLKRARLAEWITCPWCVSPYAAVLVVTAQSLIPTVWFYVACVLAFSAVSGILAESV